MEGLRAIERALLPGTDSFSLFSYCSWVVPLNNTDPEQNYAYRSGIIIDSLKALLDFCNQSAGGGVLVLGQLPQDVRESLWVFLGTVLSWRHGL